MTQIAFFSASFFLLLHPKKAAIRPFGDFLIEKKYSGLCLSQTLKPRCAKPALHGDYTLVRECRSFKSGRVPEIFERARCRFYSCPAVAAATFFRKIGR